MPERKRYGRKREPLVPGERCPAKRTAKVSDPAVRITEASRIHRDGHRTCGRCGRPNVKVRQSWGDRHTAWYYERHTVPYPADPVHPPMPVGHIRACGCPECVAWLEAHEPADPS